MEVQWKNHKPTLVDEKGEFPSKVIVCPCCDGSGRSLIDGMQGHAYTDEELDELGEEFFQDMMNGKYDTTCYECGGARVTASLITIGLSPEDTDRLQRYHDDLHAEEVTRREHEAERRMGA